MIPVSSSILDTNGAITSPTEEEAWQQQMATSLKSTKELLEFLSIDETSLPFQVDFDSPFRTRISREFASLIDIENPLDPILLQVLPQIAESQTNPLFVKDPLKETNYSPVPGLIHKYPNRVLLVSHQACAIHCRYCFRRHFPYSDQRLTDDNLESALNYVQQHSQINEIILSGGDPLNLSDEKLAALIQRIEALEQITTIRFHTRTPVVIPSRLTDELKKITQSSTKNIIFVFHINHSNEISDHFSRKVARLKGNNVTLLNQTVLLKKINDSAATLTNLSNDLFNIGILPYYLHALDPVEGTPHFDVPIASAQTIWREMQGQLSGYLVPKLVREIPNRQQKTWINGL
jgi:EF-P beta-lysylation protein EpmB